MRITQLESFVKVAREKSFSQAARALFVSQSALTQQIASLEHELGFSLFDRSSRKVELTSAGERFLESTRHILSELKGAIHDAQNISENKPYHLTLGCSDLLIETLSFTLQNHAVASLDLAFELLVSEPVALIDRLKRGELDCAFVSEDDFTPEATLDFSPVVAIEYHAALSPQNPLAAKERLRRNALATEHLILPSCSRFSPFYTAIIRNLKAESATLSYEEHDDYRIVRSFIALGKGVGIVPVSPSDKRNDDLSLIPLDPPLTSRAGFVRLAGASRETLRFIEKIPRTFREASEVFQETPDTFREAQGKR
jgi:DNA-binding transcriptional LysR family regulator